MDVVTLALCTKKIAEAISGVTQFDYKVVETLPAVGVKGVIYLVRQAVVGPDSVFEEYIYIDNRFEKLGTSAISAGTGILISNNIISVNTDVIATKAYVDNAEGVQFTVTDVTIDED